MNAHPDIAARAAAGLYAERLEAAQAARHLTAAERRNSQQSLQWRPARRLVRGFILRRPGAIGLRQAPSVATE